MRRSEENFEMTDAELMAAAGEMDSEMEDEEGEGPNPQAGINITEMFRMHEEESDFMAEFKTHNLENKLADERLSKSEFLAGSLKSFSRFSVQSSGKAFSLQDLKIFHFLL